MYQISYPYSIAWVVYPKNPSRSRKIKLGVMGSTDLAPDRDKWRTLFNTVMNLGFHGHEAAHPPPISVEVKKRWTYTSTPPYVFMA
jgi:hypothetical protein